MLRRWRWTVKVEKTGPLIIKEILRCGPTVSNQCYYNKWIHTQPDLMELQFLCPLQDFQSLGFCFLYGVGTFS